MADYTDTSNLGMGGAFSGASAASNPYLQQSNPYLQQMIDSASNDMVKNYNLSAQPAFNAAMVRSGSFGNSGIDEMNRQAQSQLQQNLGSLSNQMRFQDYNNQQGMYQWQQQFDAGNYWNNQNFNRNIYNDAFSQQQANFNNGLGLLGLINGFNQQDLSNATTIQNTPLNYLQMFANTAGGLGSGGQTQTVNGGNASDPLASALGGAMAGNRVQNWWNGNSGTGSTWNSINSNAAANGYGNTFQQNGFSADQAYG